MIGPIHDLGGEVYVAGITDFTAAGFLDAISHKAATPEDVETMRMHPLIVNRLIGANLLDRFDRVYLFLGIPVFSDSRLDRGDGRFATQVNMRDGQQLVLVTREM